MIRRTTAVLPLLACCSLVFSQDTGGEPAGSGTPAGGDLGVDSTLSFDARAAPFGTEGQQHWSVRSGVGFEFEDDDDATGVNLMFAYHRFIVDDLEFIGELGTWYHAQEGDDAASVNPGFTLRYHFINRDRWTVYADAGIGVLFSTDDVPDGGTSFNFMPHAGMGGTYRLSDAGLRAYFGARWHHVSNARIEGDADNPDRDGVFVYGGLMWPF